LLNAGVSKICRVEIFEDDEKDRILFFTTDIQIVQGDVGPTEKADDHAKNKKQIASS